MDLIGEFHPPTSRGHPYALTAVCMLTGFTWCVPLKTKTAEEVVKAYMEHIYSNWGEYQDTNGQWDRIQKQTFQRSHQKIRYGIFNSFTPLQTTK